MRERSCGAGRMKLSRDYAAANYLNAACNGGGARDFWERARLLFSSSCPGSSSPPVVSAPLITSGLQRHSAAPPSPAVGIDDAGRGPGRRAELQLSERSHDPLPLAGPPPPTHTLSLFKERGGRCAAAGAAVTAGGGVEGQGGAPCPPGAAGRTGACVASRRRRRRGDSKKKICFPPSNVRKSRMDPLRARPRKHSERAAARPTATLKTFFMRHDEGDMAGPCRSGGGACMCSRQVSRIRKQGAKTKIYFWSGDGVRRGVDATSGSRISNRNLPLAAREARA